MRAAIWRWFRVTVAERTNSVPLQISRAVMASAVAAVVDVGGLVLLVERGNWGPEIAAVASYLLGGAANYTLCACWVFPKAPRNASIGFAAFTLLSLVGLAITWACMHVIHGTLGLHYTAAKAAGLALAFSWNFVSRRMLLFR